MLPGWNKEAHVAAILKNVRQEPGFVLHKDYCLIHWKDGSFVINEDNELICFIHIMDSFTLFQTTLNTLPISEFMPSNIGPKHLPWNLINEDDFKGDCIIQIYNHPNRFTFLNLNTLDDATWDNVDRFWRLENMTDWLYQYIADL